MKKQDKYIPIDCSFYDRIEEAIVLRKMVWLEYTVEEKTITILTRLSNTLTQDGAEFLILPSGEHIRMDRIISLDGEPLPKNC